MRPLKRKKINKFSSASKFRHHTKKTKAANLKVNPMRGGYRL